MGLTKNILKRKKSGGKRKSFRRARRFEKKRTFCKTSLSGSKKIKVVRVRGGNAKRKLLRTNTGYFTWLSKGVTKSTRIIDLAYSSSNFEFLRTKTLVKGIVVVVDISPFRRWFEREFNRVLGKGKSENLKDEKDLSEEEKVILKKKLDAKKDLIDPEFSTLATNGKVLGLITSKPGQCGEVQGRLLEGAELQFYLKKITKKRILH